MPSSDVEIGRVERIVALRSFPGWSDVDASDLAVIANAAKARRYAAGDVLCDPHEPPDALFLVVSGSVRAALDGVETGRFGEHSAVGGLAAFAEISRGYELVALEETVALELAHSDMEEIFEDRFILLLRVLSTLAKSSIALRQKLPLGGFSNDAKVGPPRPPRPLDLIERILVLSSNFAMAGRIDSVAVLARSARELRHEVGDVVWRCGDPGDSMLSIVSGRVRCTAEDGTTWDLGAGDLAGGMCSLGYVPRWYTMEVIDPLLALMMRRDVSIDVWEDHPDLALQSLKVFAQGLLRLQRRVGEHAVDGPVRLSAVDAF
ncbi:MAG: Crp/Fnr family transcriptional regulator [Sandaracinaceae bacterium]